MVGPIHRQIKQHMGLFDSNAVTSICQPVINHFGVDFFDYTRVYGDGSESNLTTHPQWLAYYLSQQLYCYNPLEKSIDAYSAGYAYWSAASDDSKLSQMIDQKIQITQLFVVIRPNHQAGYCDFYYFGATKNNPQFEQRCLSNIDLIKQFIDYFDYTAANMIDTVHEQRLYMPQKFTQNKSEADSMMIYQSSSDWHQFISDLARQGAVIKSGSRMVMLTQREAELIPYILRDQGMRDIADHCRVSPRTVETHLTHIKNKVQASSKSELIRILREAYVG